MSLNKKHFELLLSLEKLNTLNDLSIFLNTSERNIRYQIEELNFELKTEYQILINKQNISWNGIHTPLEIVFNDINKIYYSFSTNERIALFILFSLIFKENINIALFSKKLEVSKPTLKTDIKLLQNILKENKIYLLQNENLEYYFKYTDINFIFFMVSFLNKYIIFKNGKFKPRKKSFFYSYFFEYLNPNKIFKINNTSLMNIRDNVYTSDEAFNLFIIFICLLKFYEPKLQYKENINFFKSSSEFTIIDKNFPNLNLDDKLWLCDFLIGTSYNIKNPLNIFKNWLNIEIETYKIILEYSNLKNITLIEDKILYHELLNHLKPLLYRSLKNITLGNSILREIKHDYNDSFEICKNIFLNFEKNLNLKISEDEIAFVVLLFERAIQRTLINKKIKNIAIVCNFGISTSSFLKMRLKELFKINCIQTYSLQEYQNINSQFDLIITTIDLEERNDKTPIVKVSPILTKADIENLKNFSFDISMINTEEFIYELEKFCDNLEIEKLKIFLKDNYSPFFYEKPLDNKEKFIEPFLINEVDEISSIEEGIRLCTTPLLEHRYIENSYVDSLIKESISNKNNNIYIGNRTIFPHYLNENNVFSTKFSFLKLKKPIFFKEKYCSLIICFCTNKKNIYHNFLFNLFELLETKEDEFLNLSLSELYNYLKAL
jgi:transcriptional antiterminator/mannitol/fructose-specific phosphotransferase system IIA component (Ntr-type)